MTLRKHAYSNILKFLPPKNEKRSDKNSKIFHISAESNIDCGYSLEPPRRVPTIYVFEQKLKKNVYPYKPKFYCIKVGLKGGEVKIT